MKVITERDRIRDVPIRWQQTYQDGRSGKNKIDIMHKLLALDEEDATSTQISDIIGNDIWTTLSCSECGKQSASVIEVGDELDYKSNTVWLCFNCIDKLYELMKGESMNVVELWKEVERVGQAKRVKRAGCDDIYDISSDQLSNIFGFSGWLSGRRKENALADDWEIVKEHKVIETTWGGLLGRVLPRYPCAAKVTIEWEE